jgi:hypothetical protein
MDTWPGMDTDPEPVEPFLAGLGHAGQLTPETEAPGDEPRTVWGLVFEVFVGPWKFGLGADLKDARKR